MRTTAIPASGPASQLGRLLVAVLLALSLAACEQLDRAGDTARACTAAAQAKDSLAKGLDEVEDLDEFEAHARAAENAELEDLAQRAKDAHGAENRPQLERILDEARDVCEEEGAA